jgi:hypothetical protein
VRKIGLDKDLFVLNSVAAAMPNTFITEQNVPPTGLLRGNYVVDLNPAFSFFKAQFTPTAVLESGRSLPSVTVANTYNVDPRENIFDWKCWIQQAGVRETWVDCGSPAAGPAKIPIKIRIFCQAFPETFAPGP